MKKLNKLFILLALPLLCVSCLVDDEDNDGLQGAQSSPYTVGFNSTSTLQSYFEDVGPVNIDIPVNILGGNTGVALPQDVSVTYTVDPSSTAVAGNEYTLTGSSFNIPSGTTFGNLPLQINTGGLDPDTPTQLVLKLTTTSVANTLVSSINDTFTITFVGCQSNHAGDYTSPQISAAGAPNTTITELSVNTYRIEAMPFLAFGGAGGGPAYMDFTNVCGDIQVTNWVGGSLIVCSGTFDATTGAISFGPMKIYNGSDVSTGIWFDLDPSVYTPQ